MIAHREDERLIQHVLGREDRETVWLFPSFVVEPVNADTKTVEPLDCLPDGLRLVAQYDVCVGDASLLEREERTSQQRDPEKPEQGFWRMVPEPRALTGS
jgi:hypothetical protein